MADDSGAGWGGGEGWGGEEGGVGNPVPGWLSALHPMLPEVLYAPYDADRGRYCYRKLGTTEHCGLVAFSDPARAEAYVAACLARSPFGEIRRVSLDEACDRVRGQHWRVDSVILADDPRNPLVQAVR